MLIIGKSEFVLVVFGFLYLVFLFCIFVLYLFFLFVRTGVVRGLVCSEVEVRVGFVGEFEIRRGLELRFFLSGVLIVGKKVWVCVRL